jgi:hypothetical protein
MSMRSIKWMLLGICIMLFGGFILADPSSNLGGIEFIIMLIGLFISVAGFMIKAE